MCSIPQAEKVPGWTGTTTAPTSSWPASAAACIGPAPPKATSENSRGSIPRWIVIVLMASAILALTTSRIPCAIASTPSPSGRPTAASAWRAASASSAIPPPAKRRSSILPSTKLASVTVGSLPPRP